MTVFVVSPVEAVMRLDYQM